MNLVTLTIHSPSHACATIDAKVRKRKYRIAESMTAGGVRGRSERGRGREKGRMGSVPLSSTADVERRRSSFSNHKGSTDGDHRGRLSLVFSCKVKLQISDQER